MTTTADAAQTPSQPPLTMPIEETMRTQRAPPSQTRSGR
jgi:hypothetical protein